MIVLDSLWSTDPEMCWKLRKMEKMWLRLVSGLRWISILNRSEDKIGLFQYDSKFLLCFITAAPALQYNLAQLC